MRKQSRVSQREGQILAIVTVGLHGSVIQLYSSNNGDQVLVFPVSLCCGEPGNTEGAVVHFAQGTCWELLQSLPAASGETLGLAAGEHCWDEQPMGMPSGHPTLREH